MLKQFSGAISLLSAAFIINGCTTEQLNTINQITENLKDLKQVTININNLSPSDIEEVQIDDQVLGKDEYVSNNNKVEFSDIQPGRHIIKLKHTKYGYVDFPVEVREDLENFYQFKPNIVDNKIADWEIGIDQNQDGLIEDSFFSKKFEEYIMVKEFSGKTNYLPGNNYRDDFKQRKYNPKPDFAAPPPPKNNENPNRPLFLPNKNNDERPLPPNNNNSPLFSRQVELPLPEIVNELDLVAIAANERVLPKDAYKKEDGALLFKGDFLEKNKRFDIYLIDETGQGVLLVVKSDKPLLDSDPEKQRQLRLDTRDINFFIKENVNISPQLLNHNNDQRQPPPPPPPQASDLNSHRENIYPVNENGTKKYITVDERGEITGYADPSNIQGDKNIALRKLSSRSRF